MSLLRRVERNREDLFDGLEEDPPAPPPIPPQGPLQELWHHTAAGKLFVTTITRDGRFIIAGSQAGEILFFDLAGRLLWKGQVEGAVNRLAVADDADCFVAGTIERGQNAYVWHFSGQLLHTLATEGATWGLGITPDASLIVVGSLDQHLYAFDRGGERLFRQPVGSPIRHLALTADGEMIVAGCDDHHVVAYDRAGQRRWAFQTGGRVWAGVRLAKQARVLVAGSNDGIVYGLDFDGHERWRYDTGGPVNNLTITPDGRLCAAAGQSNTVYLLNEHGNVLWEYQASDQVYGLALSPDGNFMAAGSVNHTVHLIDQRTGHRAWKHQTGGRVYSVAMTLTGQYFAAACADHTLYAFKNMLAEDDPDRLTRPPSRPLMRLVVQRVRAEYASAPHAGLVRWFSEFEKSLRSGQYDACQALLDEVHGEGGILLSEGEQQVTRSLEGVYWLFRGVAHHRLGQTAEARTYYEQSKTIQEALNNQDGVGQVIAALSLLPSAEATAETDSDDQPPISADCLTLLDEITNRPRVLGLSEKLLAQRLGVVPPPEQLQIILLARQSGYLSPLLKGLSADERVIRAAASAALVMLDPGPDYNVLGKMLESAESFVQWQALRMLRERVSAHADQFAAAQSQLWPVMKSPGISSTPDPLARREAVLLVKDAGSAADTPWLLERMDDPDADVQIAAAEALGAVGDRRALLRLKRVQSRAGFMGRDLAMAATDARNAIEVRYPLPTIERVVLCGVDPLQHSSVSESSLFLTGADAVYGVVTIDHVQVGAQITVRWRDGDTVLREEQHTLTDEQPRIAEIQETATGEPESGTAPGRRPFRRPPLGGRDSSDEPRFNPFRRRTPDESDEADDEDEPIIPRRSPFARDESRPGASTRPPSPSSRRAEPPVPPRPSIFGDRPRPRPFGERPPLGGDAPERPARSPFGTGRSPFGRRENENTEQPAPSPRSIDPNENVEPSAIPEPASERPPAPRLGGRFGSLPRPTDRSREADLPPWLREAADDNDEPGFRPPGLGRPPASPFARSGTERPSSLFGSRPGRPAGQANNRPGFGRSPRSDRSATARQIVVSLPRPEDGWKNAAYQLEVVIDGESSRRETPFKFISAIKLLGLEPGVAAQTPEDFSRTPVFLSGTQYIDCLVHLEEAPVNTPVTGRLYNRITGTLLAENSALTPRQGQQAVQLSWENLKWPAGQYRVAVSVEQGNELSTDVEVVSRIRADQITLCHRIDKNSGPIGTNWPFRPGDTCCCVVEFKAPPSGVEVSATWYRKSEAAPINQMRPVTTTAAPDQRKVFNLTHIPLTPGHYSVVIEGKNLVREERTFEVLPYSSAQIAARLSHRTNRVLSPLLQKYPLAQVIMTLILTVLLAGAFGLADDALDRTAAAGTRSGDSILQIAHGISQPSLLWVLLWLAFGTGYGALHARYVKRLGSETENRAYEAVNLLLVFAGGALAWYLTSTILFGVGHLWPDEVWGLFEHLLWLTPVMAWVAPIAGAVLAEWQREDDKDKPFHLGVVRAVAAVVILMLAGWSGALALGLSLGLLGSVIGNLLDMAGLGTDLSGDFLAVGAGLGFVLGVIGIVLYALRRDLNTVWKEWQRERNERHNSPSLLTFLVEADDIPVKARDYLAGSRVAVLALVVMGIVTLAAWAALEPVVLPGLEFLYQPEDSAAFEDAVMAAPLAAALALALLLAWPVLVWSVYRRLVLPRLGRYQRGFFRLYSLGAAALVAIVPIAVLIAARSLMNGDLEAGIGIFWTNRAASVAVFGGFALWLALLIANMPPTLKPDWKFNASNDEMVMMIVAILAGLLLPGWIWAVLLILVLAVFASAPLLHRVR